MSLAGRISAVQPNYTRPGHCVTCAWLETLTDSDRRAFDDWMDSGASLMQLHEIARTDPDNPLEGSFTALRNHKKHHQRKA